MSSPDSEPLGRSDGGARKVAALLIAMGKPAAGRVLRHFSDSEIRRVVETMASMGVVSRDSLEEFVAEMAAAVERGADVRAGIENVEQLLGGIIQPEQLASIMSGLRGEQRRSVWARLAELPEKTIAQFILKEHPQTAAFVLSKTPPGTATAILAHVLPDMRAELMRRFIAMRPVKGSAAKLLETAIEKELFAEQAKDSGQAIHTRAADIMNRMEKHQIDEILSDLDQRRPKDAKLVKGLLFTFEDIANLSSADRVKLFDGVPSDTTILALQDAPAELRDLILSSVSSRARRMIEQEVAGASNIPAKEITRARRAIADLALELAERGIIDMGREKNKS